MNKQLVQIDPTLRVNIGEKHAELDMSIYSSWDDCFAGILEELGVAEDDPSLDDLDLYIDEPLLEAYYSAVKVENEVFEALNHAQPLVVLDYAHTEGVGLETAINEAVGRLVCSVEGFEQFAKEQKTQELGVELSALERALNPHIDWSGVAHDLKGDYVVGQHYIFH